MIETTKKILGCIGSMLFILGGGTIFLIAFQAIKEAHQQHPVMVTIGLFAGLLALIIHEWGNIK